MPITLSLNRSLRPPHGKIRRFDFHIATHTSGAREATAGPRGPPPMVAPHILRLG